MIAKYINLPVFLISFAIGIFFVYIRGVDMKTVYVYPTPDNIKDIEYVDMANNCFQFESTKVSCPSNMKNVKDIPIQN